MRDASCSGGRGPRPAAGQHDQVADYQTRLALYRNRQPDREVIGRALPLAPKLVHYAIRRN